MPRRDQHVAKQFNAFSNEHGRHQRHAGNVFAGTRQAGNYASFDRVGRNYHNWDFTCCLLRRQCAGHIERHDHIDLKPNQLGHKLWELIQPPSRGAKLKCNVLPFHIAKFTQSFPELPLERLRVCEAYVERAYSSHLGLLRPRRERPCDRSAAKQHDELASPHHSITSSARASSVGGTSRPSAFAAFRLMTSSNLVDCTTGRSAGFSPLRTRP